MTIDLVYVDDNLFGRLTKTDCKKYGTARMERRTIKAKNNFMHRTKNGIYDPLTYYHLTDLLLKIPEGEVFRTNELLYLLDAHYPQLVWDAVTVGRVLTDIAVNLHEAYKATPISAVRRWNGMAYAVHDHPEFRAMLHALLTDLYKMSEEHILLEIDGQAPKRMNSPLQKCPSMYAPKMPKTPLPKAR